MIALFPLILPVLVETTGKTECPRSVITLTESYPFFGFLKGPYTNGISCSLTINFPEGYLLEVHLPKYSPNGGNRQFVTDSDGHIRHSAVDRDYFAPPQINFNYQLFDNDTVRDYQANFRIIESKAFATVEYVNISSNPSVFPTNVFKPYVTYVFVGAGEVSGYYIPGGSSQMAWMDQTSLVVFNGNGMNSSLTGSVWYWKDPKTDFSIYNVGRNIAEGLYQDLVVAMPTDYLKTYSMPVFYHDWMEGTVQVVLSASLGQTFASVVQSGDDAKAFVFTNFTASEDAVFYLLTGLPGAVLNDSQIIGRYNSSTIDFNYTMVMQGTKSILLLKGTLSFVFDNNTPNVPITDGARGILYKDPDSNPNDDIFWEMSLPQPDGLTWRQFNFTCTGETSSDAHLQLWTVPSYVVTNYLVLSEPIIVTTREGIGMDLYEGAVIEFSVVEVAEPTTSTTRAPGFWKSLFG